MENQSKKGEGAGGFQVLSRIFNLPAGKTGDVLLHRLLLRSEQELLSVNPEPDKKKRIILAYVIIVNIKQVHKLKERASGNSVNSYCQKEVL